SRCTITRMWKTVKCAAIHLKSAIPLRMRSLKASRQRAWNTCEETFMTATGRTGALTTLGLLMMVVTVGAADLTGGWKGTLASSDGSQAEVQVDFSPQGFPLYSYTNNKGVARQVE